MEAVSSRVTFIVPTKNSGRTIRACAESIRAQTYADVELVVVDNDSSDQTVEIASTLADRLVRAGPERSAQRNRGARESSGDFLVFLDSDMIAAPTVAEEVVDAFRADAKLQGLVIPERSIGEGFWARCRALEKDLYRGDPDVEAARAFRRKIFIEIGGYDERIHGGGEDWDLPERIVEAGGLLGRTTAGVVHDEGRLILREDIGQKFYYGRTLGRYIRKRPERATRKFLRVGLVRNAPRLARHPVLGIGILTMKTLELVAVLAGIGLSVASRHPAERRTTA